MDKYFGSSRERNLSQKLMLLCLNQKRIADLDYMRRAGPLSRAGSVCQDLGTSVKHTKNQLRDYMEKFQPG